MKLSIYTDGSCSHSRESGGWAFYCPELDVRVANRARNTTNNRMELIAVIRALEFLKELDVSDLECDIYSDSMYVIGGLTLNWSKACNDDLWGKLMFEIDTLENVKLNFIHVKGHAGDPGNTEVDKLAVLVNSLWEK